MSKFGLTLVLCMSVAGCGLMDSFEDATADRPNARQSRAIGNVLGQAGTMGAVFSDSQSADGQDLADIMEFSHFANAVEPDFALDEQSLAAAPTLGEVLDELTHRDAVPDCITENGDTITFTNCDVPIPVGRTCILNGTITKSESGNSTNFSGTLDMTSSAISLDCPERSWVIDVTLEGDPGEPLSFQGSCQFGEEGDGNNFTGSLTITDLGLADGCDKPSTGTMEIQFTGLYKGEMVDKTLIFAFSTSPNCGSVEIL